LGFVRQANFVLRFLAWRSGQDKLPFNKLRPAIAAKPVVSVCIFLCGGAFRFDHLSSLKLREKNNLKIFVKYFVGIKNDTIFMSQTK